MWPWLTAHSHPLPAASCVMMSHNVTRESRHDKKQASTTWGESWSSSLFASLLCGTPESPLLLNSENSYHWHWNLEVTLYLCIYVVKNRSDKVSETFYNPNRQTISYIALGNWYIVAVVHSVVCGFTKILRRYDKENTLHTLVAFLWATWHYRGWLRNVPQKVHF